MIEWNISTNNLSAVWCGTMVASCCWFQNQVKVHRAQCQTLRDCWLVSNTVTSRCECFLPGGNNSQISCCAIKSKIGFVHLSCHRTSTSGAEKLSQCGSWLKLQRSCILLLKILESEETLKKKDFHYNLTAKDRPALFHCLRCLVVQSLYFLPAFASLKKIAHITWRCAHRKK